ncbi:MAG: type II toxin-antitoxin system RelE/ParE family toxin [Gammaproteobacteria bacterium]|nr:type II toxin-antitoxin system RelE/ParE family toxin [Gammaproteobacteria bacterium]
MIFIEAPPFGQVRQDYGSGGIRKVRWRAEGTGSRGGLRVIYYWITKHDHILLPTMYRKSEVSDLTPKQVRILRSLAKSLEE